jgi:riboflavin kinase/FMN adenylyltransferase
VQVWRGLDEVPDEWPRSAVSIGVFDGVHGGHLVVIGRTVEAARRLGCPAVAVTFEPHPAAVVRPDAVPLMLTTLPRRLELLAATGLDATYVLEFTREISQLSPADFARRLLAERLHAALVVVGANFRFGHRAAGDVATLRQLGVDLGFEVDAVELVGGEDAVSSTVIRSMIVAGDVAGAAAALGRPHRVEGRVVRGDARGRELGFPTANLDVPAGLAIPVDGVYAGWLLRLGGAERLAAAISIGTNPTFDGTERRVEAYVLDAPDNFDIYDEDVAIDFANRVRGMERFKTVAALLDQMWQDVVEVRRIILAGE